MLYLNCCMVVDGCIECNLKRDLGLNKILRFINEVMCFYLVGCIFGMCESVVLN